jgi:hypothetical protein
MSDPTDDQEPNDPKKPGSGKWIRAGMNAVSGAIPLAGGLLSAAAGVWGENEQEEMLNVLRAWMQMLEDELREKQRTMIDVMARLDIHDEEIAARVRSDEYQSILKKAFRNWAGTESRKKQEYIRNILTNAAATKMVSDDVVFLFMDWLQDYSEFHFAVIGELYKREGSTRRQIWENLGRSRVREDSADADLFKLLIHDLSTGHIIRQHRETDYHGNFVSRGPQRTGPRPKPIPGAPKVAKSAFDDSDRYELTALGKQFVHYAMTELTLKLKYEPDDAGVSGPAADPQPTTPFPASPDGVQRSA